MSKTKLFLLLICACFFILPIPAFADDGEDSIKNLGWLAIFCGIIGTFPFIVMIKLRKYAVITGGSSMIITRGIGTIYKPVLNFHIMMNSIGYGVGMLHGFLFSEHLESISLSLAIIMTVLMISGLLLKYTSSRNTKIFNRLLHGQFILVILLIALVVLHVLTADD
ncbi:MAG TPA: hypothetical protein VMW74_10615 [Nitrosopumilaceae archaeon]|nr:hypothetical protein [Nitrosopumilaceae archaeon]